MPGTVVHTRFATLNSGWQVVLFRQDGPGPLIGNYFLDRLSDWVFSIAIVILAYRLTNDLAIVSALLLAQVVPRLIMLVLNWRPGLQFAKSLLIGMSSVRAALLAGLSFVSAESDLWWGIPIVGALGSFGAVSTEYRSVLLPAITPHDWIVHLNLFIARIERFAMVIGSAASAALIVRDIQYAIALATILQLISLLMLLRLKQTVRHDAETGAVGNHALPQSDRNGSDNRIQASNFSTLAICLFTGAALGMGLRIILVDVVLGQLGHADYVYAGLIAVFGAGALLGPISTVRLLGRLPVEFIAAATIVALATGLVVVERVGTVIVILPILFISGLLAITGERVTATVTRRLFPDYQLESVCRRLSVAAILGQILVLIVVLGLGRVADLTVVALSLSVASFALAGLLLLVLVRERSWFVDGRRY